MGFGLKVSASKTATSEADMNQAFTLFFPLVWVIITLTTTCHVPFLNRLTSTPTSFVSPRTHLVCLQNYSFFLTEYIYNASL